MNNQEDNDTGQPSGKRPHSPDEGLPWAELYLAIFDAKEHLAHARRVAIQLNQRHISGDIQEAQGRLKWARKYAHQGMEKEAARASETSDPVNGGGDLLGGARNEP